MLERYKQDAKKILARFATMNESWTHYYDVDNKMLA